jgi:3-methyladenine DNA glycosylase AlkD
MRHKVQGEAGGWGVGEANAALITAVREGLAALADAESARTMQAYMKSAMPLRGVHAPQQREVFRRAFAAHPLASAEEWRATVLALWREATYREERYAAVALTGDRRYRAYQRPDALPLYEELIITGAWWDLVDELAIHRVGDLLRRDPEPMGRTLLAWSRDADPWKRRTAILAQNASKAQTDGPLLYACIEPNLRDPDFFIRKAIGWALREYAKTDPDAVRSFLARERGRFAPLTVREALKNIGA